MKNAHFILDLTQLPILAAAVLAWRRYASLSKGLRIFSWFIFCSAGVQLLSMLLSYQHINNMPLLHIYVPVGTIGLLWFYHEVFHGFVSGRLFPLTAIAMVIFSIANAIWLEPIDTFCVNTLAVQGVLMIILSLSLFTFLLDDRAKIALQNHLTSLNWINSGLFLYFSTSQILFFLEDWMTSFSSGSFQKGWILHTVFIALMYTCFFIGLWKYPRNQIS